MSSSDAASPLVQALREHRVSARVVDVDHYRIQGGLAVESDFIVTVNSENDASFEAFSISKTYSAFRTFAQQLKKVAAVAKKKKNKNKQKDNNPETLKLIKYCDLVFHSIDAQRTTYLGKVNFMYVKVLAKQRKQIIDDVLSATCSYFPSTLSAKNNDTIAGEVASIVEAFLLTDHVILDDDDASTPLSMSTSSRDKRVTAASVPPTLDSLNPLAWIKTTSSKITKNTTTTTKGGGSSSSNNNNALSVDTTAAAATKVTAARSVVIPITRRSRKSHDQREQEESELSKVGEDARLLVDDDRQQHHYLPNYARPVPVVRSSGSPIGRFFETNPLAFCVIAGLAIVLLQKAAKTIISTDGDIFLLVTFACYCLGLHTPRPAVDLPVIRGTAVRPDRSGRKLLRRSMIVTSPVARNRASLAAGLPVSQHLVASLVGSDSAGGAVDIDECISEGDEDAFIGSPMGKFPEGAAIGSHHNCWSSPPGSCFLVRGPNYLHDKKKVASKGHLFPCRGLDLFLTDACPENVGRFAGINGGKLREKPSFIVNFRLPWGVLLFYCEIPKKFLPFLEAKNEIEKDKLIPALKQMTPGERTAARWIMSDSDEKNKTFKIVPVVVDGPWVVKSVVGGKPALIGAKLPVSYVYQPAEGDGKAPYLEADLDIAAASAARGIMSVCRSYTQVLTIDLGFVIQGNEPDELPEQMLMGARLHGIDPVACPAFPASDADLLNIGPQNSDEESV